MRLSLVFHRAALALAPGLGRADSRLGASLADRVLWSATTALLVISGVAGRPAVAQFPELVKDICDSQTWGSDPRFGKALGNKLVFLATGSTRPGVWVSDGTMAGTLPIRDVDCYSFFDIGSEAGFWHFAASCGDRELQLWRSDGTPGGTRSYASFTLPEWSAGLLAAHLSGGRDFLLIENSPGVELWVSEDASGGARMLATVSDRLLPAGTAFLVATGSRVYFPGANAAHGIELWSSDGTAAGTGMVRDLVPGTGDSNPAATRNGVLGGSLFFTAQSVESSGNLCVTDGTPGGTRFVQPLVAGTGCNKPSTAGAAFAGAMLFHCTDAQGNTGIWRTDAGITSTEFVAPGAIGTVLGPLNGKLAYANDGGVFVTSGTAAGTKRLRSFQPPTAIAGTGVATASKVFFPVYEYSGSGTELWATDGTEAGTGLVLDIIPGSGASNPVPMAAIGDVAYFAADDPNQGRELWRSEGTPLSTWMVSDVNPSTLDTLVMGLQSVGSYVYFWAEGCGGQAVWRSAGTAESTIMLRDLKPIDLAFIPLDVHPAEGSDVLFAADDGVHGIELWRSDGTPEGTRLVVDLEPGPFSGGGWGLARFGNRVFFSAFTASHGSSLWATDGTAERTTVVASTEAGTLSNTPENLTATGSQLFFFTKEQAGSALWVSDGTPEGTSRIIGPESGFYAESGLYNRVEALGDRVFFGASDGVHGQELWSSDGTFDGTRMVRDILPPELVEYGGGVVMGLTRVGSRIVFAACDREGDWELWSSDGTEGGTSMIKDIYPGPEGSYPALASEFFDIGDGRFCFSAFDPEHWRELWCSDGTAEGTRMVVDSLPYPYNMRLWDLVPVGSRLVFSFTPQSYFCDTCPEHAQLWITDGTAEGSRKLNVPMPPDLRTMPYRMVAHQGCVYFPGYDTRHGWELWRICPDQGRSPRKRVRSGR